MNESISNTSSSTPPSASYSHQGHSAEPIITATAIAPAPSHRVWPLYLGVLLLAIALGLLWWSEKSDDRQLRQEIAQRLSTAESQLIGLDAVVKSHAESSKELSATVNVLQVRQQEAQASQQALQHMYQDFSRNSDGWVISEVERVLLTANQQLQLTGNVQGALLAIDSADKMIAASNNPQFVVIRRAIENDRQHLKALPVVDITGYAIKLDNVIEKIDHLPLMADMASFPEPVAITSAPTADATATTTTTTTAAATTPAQAPEHPAPTATETAPLTMSQRFAVFMQAARAIGKIWLADSWREFSGLIRVRSVPDPDVMTLSPSESYFVKENVKLRLLNARLGLMARDEVTYRNDLVATRATFSRYFDLRQPEARQVLNVLADLQANSLSIDVPALESLTALQVFKGKS
jgi:uroporphyrin-3 C-methyltransferase